MAETEPWRTKQQQSAEAGAGESEHRKRKRRESLSSLALEWPADGTPGMNHVPPPGLVPGRGEPAARLPAQPLRALVWSPRCLLVTTTAWWCPSS